MPGNGSLPDRPDGIDAALTASSPARTTDRLGTVRAAEPGLVGRAAAAARRHAWKAIVCILAGAVAAVVITFTTVPVYVARATVQVKGRELPDLEALRSRALAERVIDRLQLADDPLLDPPPPALALVAEASDRLARLLHRPEPGTEARRAERVDRFLAGVAARPRRGSLFVDIGFASPNPIVAADVANALAEEFVTLAVGELVDATQKGRATLERQLEVTTSARKQAEDRLQSFVHANEMIPADPRESIEYKKLAELTEALTRAQSRRIEKEALHRQATTPNGGLLPQLAANPVVTGLTTEVAKLEAERARLGEAPTAEGRRIQAQLETLRGQLRTAQEALADTLRADFEAAGKQESLLAQALEAQKAVIGELNQRAIDYEVLKRTVDADRELERRLQQQLEAAPGGGPDTAVELAERAPVPYRPDRPRPLQNLGIGVLVGAFVAFMLIGFEEHLDNSLRTAAEAERELGLPVLACLPVVRVRRTNGKAIEIPPELVSGEEPRCLGTEAVRGLRAALFLGSASGPPQRVLVTSARPREGKSCVAANLAIVLSQMGRRVALVDCDFRRPRLHRIFGHDGRLGATSFLTGAVELPALVRPSDYGPSVLSSGPLPADPLALIDSAPMAALLDELSRRYDFVILDAPPVLGLPDVPLLSRLVGGLLLVVRANDTPRAAVRAATDELRRLRANILGVVLNRGDATTLGYLGTTYESYFDDRPHARRRRATLLLESREA